MTASRQLLKILALPIDISRILKYLADQKNFLAKNIRPILETGMQTNDGSLDHADLDKINQYYGLAVPAILGEAFCSLRGKKMSVDERWASTCQGAMTGLFDDFFDKQYLSDQSVAEMIAEKGSASTLSNEKLFNIFYRTALKYSPSENSMLEALKAVYNAQVGSKDQKNGSLSNDELLDLTFKKGGSSVIFYRTAFLPVATEMESTLLYNLGGLMQLANDIFDVYKDREGNIQTMITGAKHIAPIRNFLRSQLIHYFNDSYGIGYPHKNVERFFKIISIGIFSRCFVCLDQLEANERSTDDEFIVQLYSRKQLICDMDKGVNLFRSARSHIVHIP
ncbi:MAG: hypothetical protein ABIO04_09745 [Ferruginibacter sp.]